MESMWLRVTNTNNDPRVIAKHFIDCVRMIGGRNIVSIFIYIYGALGCPTVRSDCGTENTHIAFIQPCLQHHHSDSFAKDKSFLYGRSTANQVDTVYIYRNNNYNNYNYYHQRIEAFWCQLRSRCIHWWIDFFKV